MIVGERNYPLTEDDTPMTHSDTAMVHLSEAFRAGGGASVVDLPLPHYSATTHNIFATQ